MEWKNKEQYRLLGDDPTKKCFNCESRSYKSVKRTQLCMDGEKREGGFEFLKCSECGAETAS